MICDDYDFVMPARIVTPCIICGSSIVLKEGQSDIVPRVCDECKNAVKFVKEFMSDGVHIVANTLRQSDDDMKL